MKVYYKIKWFFLALLSLIVSPFWIVGVALWEIRSDALSFYKDIYLGLTFRLNDAGRRHIR